MKRPANNLKTAGQLSAITVIELLLHLNMSLGGSLVKVPLTLLLFPSEPTRILKQPEYKVVQRGRSVVFECKVKHDPTLTPTITWLKDDGELPDDERSDLRRRLIPGALAHPLNSLQTLRFQINPGVRQPHHHRRVGERCGRVHLHHQHHSGPGFRQRRADRGW